jgi:DUF1365 family protein
MKSAFYAGYIGHKRYIPRNHSFKYPFFMWFLDLEEVDSMSDIGWWFSSRKFALSRFHRPDYLGPDSEPLQVSVKNRMAELTGHNVEGKVFGLLNLRTLGLYFSPVNFYFGYSAAGTCTHMLAEVSNIPWNERHHYAHYLGDTNPDLTGPKQFKVSPFNPVDQHYKWEITPPEETVAISIGVDDERGHVFDAGLDMKRYDLSAGSIRRRLLRRPVMTASIVASIYWQALKLFLKGVPYVPYQKEMT